MGASMKRLLLSFLLIILAVAPANAQAPADEAAIRELIDKWYVEHRAADEGHPWAFLAPGGIDRSPGYRHVDTGAAVLGPPVYTSLAATSLQFSHEITRLIVDTRFAKVNVRERGYFYAWAAQRTYERLGSALFVLEKQDSGRWLVLAHSTSTVGIPPNLKTDPMPDLRDLFYSTEGKGRDPQADAEKARQGG
jgi:hypothetical protein